MPCTKPLLAYRSLSEYSENGNAKIYFKKPLTQDRPTEEVELPCGQCMSCRISRSREWALRCTHEASHWEQNCFITLTINDQNLSNKTKECKKCPIYKKNDNHKCEEGSLCKRDFQLFMKRLRKRYQGYEPIPGTKRYPIRYFHCGEYGAQLRRPHHHACIFNFNFPDRVLWKRASEIRASGKNRAPNSYSLYRSKILEELWPYGFSTIGQMNWQTAAYVARYVTKKINGDQAATHYLVGHPDTETGESFYLEPEYITMSREPGIGAIWFKQHGAKQYDKDYITHDGNKFPIPGFYDKIYAEKNPIHFKQIKRERRQRAKELTPADLRERIRENQAREIIQNQRFSKLMRSVENDLENVLSI